MAKQLEELLLESRGILDTSVDECKEISARIKKIRIQFTHYPDANNPEFGTGEEFFIYGTLLKWVLIGCLLEEIGFLRKDVDRMILRSQPFLQFKLLNFKRYLVAKSIRRDEKDGNLKSKPPPGVSKRITF